MSLLVIASLRRGAKDQVKRYGQYLARMNFTKRYFGGQPLSSPELKDQLASLARSAPAALAQVMVKHPEYAGLVCESINLADTVEKQKQKNEELYTYGGLIVGGGLMLTGVGSGIGAAVLAGTTTGAILTTVAGSAALLGTATGLAEVVYLNDRSDKLKAQHDEGRAALFATGSSDIKGWAETKRIMDELLETNFNLSVAAGFLVIDAASLGNTIKSLDQAEKIRYLRTQKSALNVLKNDPEKLKKFQALRASSGEAEANKFLASLGSGELYSPSSVTPKRALSSPTKSSFNAKPSIELHNDVMDTKFKLRALQQSENPDRAKLQLLEKTLATKKSQLRAANDDLVKRTHALYVKQGYPTRIVKKDGYLILEFDFTESKPGHHAYTFYQRIQKKFGIKKFTFSPEETFSIDSRAYYDEAEDLINGGIASAEGLLEDLVTHEVKHEAKHAMFKAMREKGVDSVFHTQFSAGKVGTSINFGTGGYASWTSAEELYNFSTDLKIYINDPLGPDLLNHNRSLRSLAQQTQFQSDALVEKIDRALLSPREFSGALQYGEEGKNLTLTVKTGFDVNAKLTFVTPQDRALFTEPLRISEEMDQAFLSGLDGPLKERGWNKKDLLDRIDTLSPEEEKFLLQQKDQFEKSELGKSLERKMLEANKPLLRRAREKLSGLRAVAGQQVEEAAYLAHLLKQLRKSPDTLKEVQAQIHEIGRKVKEGQKDFILKKKE